MNKLVYKGQIRKTEKGQIAQVQKALDKLYTVSEQFHLLTFYGDIDTETYYSFDIREGNSRFELRYMKDSGLVFKVNKK